MRLVTVYEHHIFFAEGIFFVPDFQVAFALFDIDQEKAVVIVSLDEIIFCTEIVSYAKRVEKGLFCSLAGGVEEYCGFFGTAVVDRAHVETPFEEGSDGFR